MDGFRIRVTGDGSGTLDAVKVRVELVDFTLAAGQVVVDPDPDPDPEPMSLGDLTDVTLTDPQDGDALVSSSGTWENQPL